MLSPTTELSAVNTMLSSIGESPVNSLEDSGVVDAVLAQDTLHRVSREVQARGWHWNTEESYPLEPTYIDNYLYLPQNALRVTVDDLALKGRVAIRGERLYDRVDHTFRFDKPVNVSLVLNLAFDQVPEVARIYITLRSARIFQEHTVGSAELSGFGERDEIQAKLTLEEHEGDTGDYNMFTGSWSVAEVLTRS